MVWAAWHIPYYYFFLSQDVLRSQTALSIPTLILISQSVWPAWLMHTVSNAFSFAIVGGGFVAASANLLHVFFTPGIGVFSMHCYMAWLAGGFSNSVSKLNKVFYIENSSQHFIRFI